MVNILTTVTMINYYNSAGKLTSDCILHWIVIHYSNIGIEALFGRISIHIIVIVSVSLLFLSAVMDTLFPKFWSFIELLEINI